MLEKNQINNKIMRLADNIFLYKLDEEQMWLFNTDSGDHWNLNEQSHYVLSQFDGKKTLDKISQLYAQQYAETGVSKEELMQDFKSLTHQFIASNIIVNETICNQEVKKDGQ